jgi:hypothetical protein
VHGIEREIEEEGLCRIMLLDKPDRIVAEQSCGIALLLDDLIIAVPVDLSVDLVGEIIDLADQWTVLVVEAALPRPEFPVGMAEMPFTDDGSLVAGIFQSLRQEPLVSRKPIGVPLGNDGRL